MKYAAPSSLRIADSPAVMVRKLLSIDPQEHRGLGGLGVVVLMIRGNVILVIEK